MVLPPSELTKPVCLKDLDSQMTSSSMKDHPIRRLILRQNASHASQPLYTNNLSRHQSVTCDTCDASFRVSKSFYIYPPLTILILRITRHTRHSLYTTQTYRVTNASPRVTCVTKYVTNYPSQVPQSAPQGSPYPPYARPDWPPPGTVPRGPSQAPERRWRTTQRAAASCRGIDTTRGPGGPFVVRTIGGEPCPGYNAC